MLTVRLETRFRSAIGEPTPSPRDETIAFSVDFVRLLARALPDPITRRAIGVVRTSLSTQSDLAPDEIDVLVNLACTPEYRAEIHEDQIRAYGARFGASREAALRASLAEELEFHAFGQRYGAIEGLVLLDALFAVCAEDGVISRDEIAGLQRSASDLQIDPVLVSALFRKHDSRHAKGDFRFELTPERYVVGRSPGADISLPDPQVAHQHVEILPTPNGWRVMDLASGRPTLLNGVRISSAPFAPGDELRVGPYALKLGPEGRVLTAFGKTSASALTAHGLSRKIGDVTLLEDISFTVFSGEVIALVGPSGAGKTTLLNAITGIAPADSGSVFLDGRDFHDLLESDRSMVGVVPQEDVVHAELTVEESLQWAARLRFGADVTDHEIAQSVNRVLEELGIEDIRDSRIGDAVRRGISGGQRKRVSLGHELLTQSTRVLFLDEPTSGLDPRTSQDIVAQIRQLADDGRIVFLVTHDMSPSVLSMVDHLLVLVPGGRLGWFGPPEEAAEWFEVASADEMFGVLPQHSPASWQARYRASGAYRKYVRTREHVLGLTGVTKPPSGARVNAQDSHRRQYRTLTARYATVKLRDHVGTAVLLGQAPILAIAMCLVFPHADTAAMFMLMLSALWFGASASVRELISERAIYHRERRVGVGTFPYLASKVTVLGALITAQCVSLTAIVWWWLDMAGLGFNLVPLSVMAALTGLSGMGLGLMLSSIFRSSEAAVGSLPLMLIPQITFGGLIVPLRDMPVAAHLVAALTVTRYAFEGAIGVGDCLYVRHASRAPEPYCNLGVQHDLGFRTSAVADHGLSYAYVCLILVAFTAAFLLATAAFTRRTDAS